MPFGQGIDARLMNVDWSALERAGQYQGQAMANLGQSIGQGIADIGKQFKQYKDQQKQEEQKIQTASRIAELLGQKAPDIIPGIGEFSFKLQDKEIPHSQRLADADYILNALKIGVSLQENERANRMMKLREDELARSSGGGPQYPPAITNQKKLEELMNNYGDY